MFKEITDIRKKMPGIYFSLNKYEKKLTQEKYIITEKRMR
jgi:hypothetical protein